MTETIQLGRLAARKRHHEKVRTRRLDGARRIFFVVGRREVYGIVVHENAAARIPRRADRLCRYLIDVDDVQRLAEVVLAHRVFKLDAFAVRNGRKSVYPVRAVESLLTAVELGAVKSALDRFIPNVGCAFRIVVAASAVYKIHVITVGNGRPALTGHDVRRILCGELDFRIVIARARRKRRGRCGEHCGKRYGHGDFTFFHNCSVK